MLTSWRRLTPTGQISFLFGHSSTLVEIMKRNGVVHDKFLEWTEIYGPAYRINLLHYVMVFVACPETTKEMLMSPKYTKDKFLRDKIANLFGQRARKEVDEVIGMKQDISYDDLGHLGYLSQVRSLFLNKQQSFITIFSSSFSLH
ncbi:unnamed protein product [Tetraodon nigroviridis]|uniref:(spotted green pufferfish) hypothetical protein n=1 Tax=Tetraodon nigroviridis TaxID=99883 RepID=Q4SGY1_TETNG|nr:unnamed protein product [Tetraodon nigroviridis]